jgi:fatty acid-binding protein DegV
MKFKVVTDSSSDIHELLGVDFESSPLKIITDDKEYIDDKNLDVARAGGLCYFYAEMGGILVGFEVKA